MSYSNHFNEAGIVIKEEGEVGGGGMLVTLSPWSAYKPARLADIHSNNTVEPPYNKPLYNKVLGITNDFLYPRPSNSKTYGKVP